MARAVWCISVHDVLFQFCTTHFSVLSVMDQFGPQSAPPQVATPEHKLLDDDLVPRPENEEDNRKPPAANDQSSSKTMVPRA